MTNNLYVRVVKRHWLTIALTMVLATLITAVATWFVPRTYTGVSLLRVSTLMGGSVDYLNYETEYSDRYMNTLIKLVASNSVAEKIQKQFGLAKLPKVKASIVAKTELIELAVEAPTPQLAMDMTNALNQVVVEQSKLLPNKDIEAARLDINGRVLAAQQAMLQAQKNYQTGLVKSPNDTRTLGALQQEAALQEKLYLSLLEQSNRLQLIDTRRADAVTVEQPATLPAISSSPNWLVNIGLGSALGLVGGIGLAFLFARQDSRLYTSEEVQSIVPMLLLGEVPAYEKHAHRLSRMFEDNTMELEGIRRLRVNLMALQQREDFKVLAVVSAEPGEGKSTVIVNLATSLARAGKRVVVVDADMRLPTLHESFNVSNQVGLSNLLLDDQTEGDAVLHHPTANVSLLTSGVAPANPGELLGLPRMQAILNDLADAYDIVLIDTPALLAAADGITVSRMAGNVIYVANCQIARYETVHSASRQIIDLGVNVLGLVVNGTERPRDYNYHRSAKKKTRYLA